MIIDAHVHPCIRPGSSFYIPEENFIDHLDECGVDRAILLAVDTDPEDVSRPEVKEFLAQNATITSEQSRMRIAYLLETLGIPNDDVVDLVNKYPDRFAGLGSIDLCKDEDYIRRKFEYIKESGLRGVKVLPTIQFFNPQSPNMLLLCELCKEEDMPIIVHTGCDPDIWEDPGVSRYANPQYLDKAAETGVTLIGAHMGAYSNYQPGVWFNEMMSLAEEYDNVLVDTSALVDRVLGEPMNLLEIAVDVIDASRILFGSDFPVVASLTGPRPISMSLEAIESANISDEDKALILGENAEQLFW